MKRSLLVLMLGVSAISLSACFSSGNKAAAPLVLSPDFIAKPVKGMSVDTARKVESTGQFGAALSDVEDINDNRFTVTFTADEKLVIEDTVASRTITMGVDDVHHSFDEADWMKMYSSFLSNVGGDSVTVFTPKAENEPEYALMRVIYDDNAHWMMIGDPTSTVLSGQATYDGGYYMTSSDINDPDGTIQGKMAALADFGTNKMDFTFHKPDADTTDAVFGMASIGFQADILNGNVISTLNGATMDQPVDLIDTTGVYDKAILRGAFFDDGNAAGGLVQLQNSTDPDEHRFGAWHGVKQ